MRIGRQIAKSSSSRVNKKRHYGNEGLKCDKWIFFTIITMVAAGKVWSTEALRRAQQFASQMRVAVAMRQAARPAPLARTAPHPHQTMSQSTPRGRFLVTMWLPIVGLHNQQEHMYFNYTSSIEPVAIIKRRDRFNNTKILHFSSAKFANDVGLLV